MLLCGACATATPPPGPGAAPAPPAAPRVAAPAPPPPPAPRVAPLPEAFESEDFVVTFAKPDDTPETLAARYLGDAARAWMIEEYMGTRTFSAGQEVIVPKRFWNPVGVEPNGYQLVPVLCYHNLDVQSKGRMVLAVKAFEEQMRYLKREGYRVINLGEFLEFASQRRQLPRKTVVLTFDDGYRSFRQHAYPILKELGFTATLFVYTDYVGAGRNALTWQELRELQAEGLEVHAHSKTHGDLRRSPGEADAAYARRLQAELEQPLALFTRHLGRTSQVVAYPYGKWDDEVVRKAKEYGYIAGFSVRRQGNPSFVFPLGGNRSQVYSEMTLEDFVKNLNVFHEETLK
jgi:peptidoglycan/xylan/chitin deacetylase (PgdA/CDA1 family)